jgi:hypothetical protein
MLICWGYKDIEKGRVKKYKELNTRIKREDTLKKLEDTYDLKTVVFIFLP